MYYFLTTFIFSIITSSKGLLFPSTGTAAMLSTISIPSKIDKNSKENLLIITTNNLNNSNDTVLSFDVGVVHLAYCLLKKEYFKIDNKVYNMSTSNLTFFGIGDGYNVWKEVRFRFTPDLRLG